MIGLGAIIDQFVDLDASADLLVAPTAVDRARSAPEARAPAFPARPRPGTRMMSVLRFARRYLVHNQNDRAHR